MLSEEHDRLLDDHKARHNNQLAVRDSVYNQELSALQAQKRLLEERLDRAHEDLEGCLDSNHSKQNRCRRAAATTFSHARVLSFTLDQK